MEMQMNIKREQCGYVIKPDIRLTESSIVFWYISTILIYRKTHSQDASNFRYSKMI